MVKRKNKLTILLLLDGPASEAIKEGIIIDLMKLEILIFTMSQ